MEHEFYIPLTAKEIEVMELLTKGYKKKKMAELLFVSISTITTHLVNIYSKLGVSIYQGNYDVRILAVNKYRRLKKEKEF